MPEAKFVTTLRIDPALKREIDRLVEERRVGSFNSLLVSFLERWKDNESLLRDAVRERGGPISTETIAGELAKNIADLLTRNPEWVGAGVLSAELKSLAHAAFSHRVDHFEAEKQILAKNFVRWILDRALVHLRTGKRVVLFWDSGTTTYPAFQYLPERLQELLDSEPGLSRLVLLTNNMPGGQLYMTRARNKKVRPPGADKGEPLSDYIPCELVGGSLLTEYAALVGQRAEETLRGYRFHPDGKPIDDVVMLGVVVGQWIRTDGRQPVHAVPLTSVAVQRSFKQTAIECCDEVYILSPLAKIFVNCEMDRMQAAFRSLDESAKEYQEVPVGTNAAKIRMVTTSRPPTSILYAHSEKVAGLYAGRLPGTDSAGVSFERIPHMMFSFPETAGLSKKEQRLIEFPHEYTRNSTFLREFFSVPERDAD